MDLPQPPAEAVVLVPPRLAVRCVHADQLGERVVLETERSSMLPVQHRDAGPAEVPRALPRAAVAGTHAAVPIEAVLLDEAGAVAFDPAEPRLLVVDHGARGTEGVGEAADRGDGVVNH